MDVFEDMDKNAKIFVAGHRGMVGSGIVRALERKGYTNIIGKTHAELDLCDRNQVIEFYQNEAPEYVILAAAKVGGIEANRKHKAEFLMDNLDIQNNVIFQAYKHGVKKLCFLGSSCIYPHSCPQPIKEEYLLSGPLEPTNEGYALAKISGYKLGYYLAEQYGFNVISLMPCNLYGTNDNYDPVGSHVFPAFIRKFADAADNGIPEVNVWGSGRPMREFLHVDDLSEAVVMMMESWNSPEFVNLGAGYDISIRELTEKVAKYAGFTGKINWDASMPDGMMRKLMDSSKARELGFEPRISLDEGIKRTLKEYRELKQSGVL